MLLLLSASKAVHAIHSILSTATISYLQLQSIYNVVYKSGYKPVSKQSFWTEPTSNNATMPNPLLRTSRCLDTRQLDPYGHFLAVL